MDISGTDNIVYTALSSKDIAVSFLDIVRSRWTSILVDIAFSAETMDLHRLDVIAAAKRIRDTSDEQRIELFFLRDENMRNHREQFGYTLASTGEGPFALYIKSRSHLQMRADAIVDIDFASTLVRPIDPYTAWLCSPSMREVAIVTPEDPAEDAFSRWLLESTLKACTTGCSEGA